jgi:hypothetical protein
MSYITTILSFCQKSGRSGKELAMMMVSTAKTKKKEEQKREEKEKNQTRKGDQKNKETKVQSNNDPFKL